MGMLGSLGSAAAEGWTGSSGSTTLQNFLDKFSSGNKWVEQIDPYNTFDVTMEFYPSKDSEDDARGLADKALDALESVGKKVTQGLMNAADSMTGGLLGSLMNQVDILNAKYEYSDIGKYSFLEYLIPANLLKSDSNWTGMGMADDIESPLILDFGLFCQEITIPNLKMIDAGETDTAFGKFPVNGTSVQPESHILQMSIVNTKVPILERIFYPWMREVTLPFWSYESQPYTTAKITIDLTKHSDIKYEFYGCRPIQINTQQPKQQNGDVTRMVTFMFDFMMVYSSLATTESLASKLMSSAGTLVNSASNMINM